MKKIFKFIFTIITLLIIVGLVVVLLPSPTLEIPSTKVLDFDTAKAQVEIGKQKDMAKVNPECQDIGLIHRQKQPKSIVIYHGFTNCPKQFAKLGGELFDLGYNVYIPRIPYHGLADVMNDELPNLTSQDLLQTMKNSYEIAAGLGDKVDFMGISGGGNMALWAGYNYKANQVLTLAPLFAPTGYSNWQIPLMQKYFQIMPNEYRWWDDVAMEKPIGGPKHAYSRYSSKAGNAFLEVVLDLQRRLKTDSSPTATDFKLLLLDGDKAVDNAVANEYFDLIDKKSLYQSPRKTLPASYNLNHDIIDPMQTQANTGLVYPIVKEMLQLTN
jgi:esterase/lipase